MNWFVGVDGGGTKTDFALSMADGVAVATMKRTGCSYQTIGIEAAITLVVDGIGELLSKAGISLADCAGCCIGMPCYGEHAENDRLLAKKLSAALAPMPVYVANDVEVGWAGSLECREGIHLVAGTGSIAFGRGAEQKTARCGGWTEFFGDEGSCYWVGREAMSLFSKEADGRVPRGALYEIVREELRLTDDYRFVDAVQEIAPHREKVADFQRYALWAAQAGDFAATALYEAAATELALMVGALRQKLSLSGKETPVSYSGGLFHAGELIIQPLRRMAASMGCVLQAPKRTAMEGAIILAIEKFDGGMKSCF